MGPDEIGQELRRMRDERGLTQEEVAGQAGLSGASTVCQIEKAKAEGRLRPAAIDVARVFGMQIIARYELAPLPRRRKGARRR